MLRDERDKPAKVSLFHRKRGSFERLPYNEHHIPAQTKIKRKPKLDAWDNPEFDWPPRFPRPTKHRGKALINELEREQKLQIKESRDWQIPNYRTGDVIRLTVIDSISEQVERSHEGLCVGKAASNSINSKATVNYGLDGTNV